MRAQKIRPSTRVAKLGAAFGLCGLSLMLGCPSEIDPATVTATVVQYGLYEIREGLPTLVEETDRIACAEGVTFGVDYRIDVTDGGYGRIPVEFRWTHPELAVPSNKLWGTETPARRSNPEIGWRESSLEGRALWDLEHPDERISGRYKFQIRRQVDGRAILSSNFFVEGC